ncbi:MAG: MMPL family transporter [Oscillospiraceae bacterium]|nr:MMPL family transporter [Oscillospiraceae bacterium]
MQKFGRVVVRFRIPILIIAVLLIIPSAFGIINTHINYDMLSYLPDDMDTVKGQNILLDEFGKGAFSLVIVEGMNDRDVAALEKKIESVDHVADALWYDDLCDITIPKEILPEKYYNAFNSGDATLLAVFFDSSSSSDETMKAVGEIRAITGKQCFVSGISALVTDLKAMCEREEPIYVTIAILCALAAMMLFMDNWIAPLIFLASIGIAIILNMGSNIIIGEISYITKALAAVLQLAVTMDYSIFLWHSYEEKRCLYPDNKDAMASAISDTITSVTGSSVTTIAGFIALCFMSYTMGSDLGIVMGKGVLLGVIGSVTTLPALILLCDPLLSKTNHRSLIPKTDKLAAFLVKRSWVWLVIFVVMLVPALYGYINTPVYYDFTNILSNDDISSISEEDMGFFIANTKLKENFDIASTHMILCKSDMLPKDAKEMLSEIKSVDGVKLALGLDSVVGSLVPEEMVPDSILRVLKSDKYQLILINSEYKVSTDECNKQIDSINSILKKYDENGMLIGEAPCTKDLIEVTDHDFTVVTWISIAAIFVIIALVLKSLSLPVILVSVIEFAIFINLGISYYTKTSMPFIAPIAISTIQLGATVDYAILMTTRYKSNRAAGGMDKQASVIQALASTIPSVLVSALGFFAATFGVGVYSNVSLISSMCNLMARGAIISMLAVIFVLPALLMLFDRVIKATSLGFSSKKQTKEGNIL